jgi:inner membrane protease subunit 1
MIPTLSNEGDWVLKESISSRLNPPRLSIGDVVISVSPADPSRTVCKRILGLAGDTVCVDPEASVPHHIVVPKGHLWLMGDNYPHSRDSRTYGPVPMGLVRGKVVAVVCRPVCSIDIYAHSVLRGKVWPRPRWLTNPLQPISGGLNSQSPQC